MVKRGIGAVVLAVIAALLLGWLLKDKSQERQDVVDMKLPGAPEMNIPSLTDAVSSVGDSAATLVENTTEKVANAGSAVVASATGAASTLTNAVTDTANSAVETGKQALEGAEKSTGKPGFSIRPAGANDQREVVDTNTAEANAPASASNTNAATKKDEVVASTNSATKKKKAAFKPSIVEKKKKPTQAKKKVAKASKPKKVEKKAETKVAPVAKKAAPALAATTAAIPSASSGKYSIQLLATSSQSRANKLARTMQGEGYKTFVTQTQKSDKILYRVRIGAHADRNAAIKAQDGLKKRYQKNFFVQNSLVISN